MVNVNRKKKDKTNHGILKTGATYEVTSDIDVVELNDEMVDLTITHQVLLDGACMQHTTAVWHGLPVEVSDAFIDALDKAGLGEDQSFTTNKAKRVSKVWKNITRNKISYSHIHGWLHLHLHLHLQ